MEKRIVTSVSLCFAFFLLCSSCDYGTVTDIEGKVYKTVIIGEQEWMAENLKTTSYRDGSPIEYPGNDDSSWIYNNQGAYAWYGNDEASHKDTYGALYNGYAVHNPAGLCPSGWCVPSDDDWQKLVDYLGGWEVAGGRIKTTGTIEDGTGLWYAPNTDATNSSGFSGLPGGHRTSRGSFGNLGSFGSWWSSTESEPNYGYLQAAFHNFGNIRRINDGKVSGFSVRCLRD